MTRAPACLFLLFLLIHGAHCSTRLDPKLEAPRLADDWIAVVLELALAEHPGLLGGRFGFDLRSDQASFSLGAGLRQNQWIFAIGLQFHL